MKHVTMLSVLLIIFPLATTRHNRSPFSQQKNGETRLKKCEMFLDADEYRSAGIISRCMMEMGILHDFSPGTEHPVTSQLCSTYSPENIRRADLRKCVFKKIGAILNTNGKDQWDLKVIRYYFIDHFSRFFPAQDEGWVTIVVAATFITCEGHPSNFDVFPFRVCWFQATEMISDIFERKGESHNYGLKQIRQKKNALSTVLLKTDFRKSF